MDQAQFAQMIIIAGNLTLKMNDVLSHPLGPRPWALASDAGLLRRIKKSSLATGSAKKQVGEYTADQLAQLVEHRTAAWEVEV